MSIITVTSHHKKGPGKSTFTYALAHWTLQLDVTVDPMYIVSLSGKPEGDCIELVALARDCLRHDRRHVPDSARMWVAMSGAAEASLRGEGCTVARGQLVAASRISVPRRRSIHDRDTEEVRQ